MNEVRWFLTALLLMFIGLRAARVIDWSWWWVLAPFWVPLAMWLVCFLPLLVYHALFETEAERNRRRLSTAINRYADALARRSRK